MLFYVCIVNKETGEIRFAEHFEDGKESAKRAIQLEAEARTLGSLWKSYAGYESYEAALARAAVISIEGETPEEYKERQDAAASMAKTISVLTESEQDDSAEARQLPPLAVAMSAVEAAQQAVIDAKQAYNALKICADNMAEEAYSQSAMSAMPEIKAELRRKAVAAQAEADYASARLYHAEQDLSAKIDAMNQLKEV